MIAFKSKHTHPRSERENIIAWNDATLFVWSKQLLAVYLYQCDIIVYKHLYWMLEVRRTSRGILKNMSYIGKFWYWSEARFYFTCPRNCRSGSSCRRRSRFASKTILAKSLTLLQRNGKNNKTKTARLQYCICSLKFRILLYRNVNMRWRTITKFFATQ